MTALRHAAVGVEVAAQERLARFLRPQHHPGGELLALCAVSALALEPVARLAASDAEVHGGALVVAMPSERLEQRT